MIFNKYHNEECFYAEFKYQYPQYQDCKYLGDCECMNDKDKDEG